VRKVELSRDEALQPPQRLFEAGASVIASLVLRCG
jgi:hypothetical protein